MGTVRLKGGAARDWIATEMVTSYGPEEALNKSCGPMREAVERVIKARALPVDRSKVEPEPGVTPRYGRLDAPHMYKIGVEGGYTIEVLATNRIQAGKIAAKEGYVVRDVNMVA